MTEPSTRLTTTVVGADAADHETRVREFVRRVWNERDYGAAGRLYGESFTNPAAPGVQGPQAKIGFVRGYHLAFPDLAVTIEDLVASDESVALRYVASGTDVGGFHGRPSTGLHTSMWAVSFLRFDGDRVVAEWVGADYLGFFEQLGVVTSPWTSPPSVISPPASG